MTLPARMKFGIFLAPFHPLGENPTLALERDLELLQWLDSLGFDEAWVGEHHSPGWETSSSAEVFRATAVGVDNHYTPDPSLRRTPGHEPIPPAPLPGGHELTPPHAQAGLLGFAFLSHIII